MTNCTCKLVPNCTCIHLLISIPIHLYLRFRVFKPVQCIPGPKLGPILIKREIHTFMFLYNREDKLLLTNCPNCFCTALNKIWLVLDSFSVLTIRLLLYTLPSICTSILLWVLDFSIYFTQNLLSIRERPDLNPHCIQLRYWHIIFCYVSWRSLVQPADTAFLSHILLFLSAISRLICIYDDDDDDYYYYYYY